MLNSSWIEDEISYSLKKISRDGTQSKRNGVVAVIKKVNGSYNWFKYTINYPDGHSSNGYHEEKIFKIIKENRCNQYPPAYICDRCKTIDSLSGSYITYVEEDEFIRNMDKYIENAYQKSLNDCSGYIVKPTV